MDAHVFVDSSNMFGGARRAAETLEPGVVPFAVRLYFSNLFKLLEHKVNAKTRIFGGSVPPGNEVLWEHARKHGYKTDLLKKVEKDDGRFGEQAVDQVLQLKIVQALLDHSPPQRLVLATGDGATDESFETSFTDQVKRALKAGWEVVVWSWREQLSGRFERLAPPGSKTLQVRELDPYYKALTFIQKGNYTFRGASIELEGRVVGKLSLPA